MTRFYDDPSVLTKIISNAAKRKPLPLEDDKFGYLISTGRFAYIISGPSQLVNYSLALECRCICGSISFYKISSLRSGCSKSCGCTRQKTVIGLSRREKSLRQKLNCTWYAMRSRCSDPRNSNWDNYGGRGIFVCDEWRSFETFFRWAIDNQFEPGLTLDRINNHGPYPPWNCRWVTQKEQCRNFRRNVLVTAWGETKCLAAWAEDPDAKPRPMSFTIECAWE